MSLSRVSQIPSNTVNIQTKHKHSSRFKFPHKDPTLCFACITNPRRMSNSGQCQYHISGPNASLSLECRYLVLRCTFFIRGNRFISSAKRPDRFWSPPIQLIPASFPGGQSGWGAKLITHTNRVLGLRMSGATPLLPLKSFMPWTHRTSQFIRQSLYLS